MKTQKSEQEKEKATFELANFADDILNCVKFSTISVMYEHTVIVEDLKNLSSEDFDKKYLTEKLEQISLMATNEILKLCSKMSEIQEEFGLAEIQLTKSSEEEKEFLNKNSFLGMTTAE